LFFWPRTNIWLIFAGAPKIIPKKRENKFARIDSAIF